MQKLKILFLVSAFGFFGFAAVSQTTWKADPAHSSVNFKVKHSGISLVTGKFEKFEGTLAGDSANFSDAKISFTVQTSSINTSVTPRDNHLRSADFFEVEKYPEMKFESTRMEKKAVDQYLLFGNLTIKNVTKPVVFEVTHGGHFKNDRGEKHGFQASYTIDRTDFNVSYDPTGAGIGKNVEINLYLQMVKQKAENP